MPDVFETIDELRAAWRFKPDAVPDDAIRKILHAATRAASAGNMQPWRFLVVRDPELRWQIGALCSRPPRWVSEPGSSPCIASTNASSRSCSAFRSAWRRRR